MDQQQQPRIEMRQGNDSRPGSTFDLNIGGSGFYEGQKEKSVETIGNLKTLLIVVLQALSGRVYSDSPSPGSDVARLFAKSSSKTCAPSEIAHTRCICVLTSLPEDGETEYR